MSRELSSAADAKRLYDQAAPLARFGVWECELDTQRLTWTDAVYDLFGFARGSELHRPSTVALYNDESRREMQHLRTAAVGSCGGFTLDARINGADGVQRWMRLTAQVEAAHGRPARIYGVKQDITHEKAMWLELRRLAYSDPLTGLANRRAFESLCQDLQAREQDGAALWALAIIDVDRFKQINDQFGHAAGDECLRQIATRLERVMEEALLIARIGGDEFAVMLRLPLGRPHLNLLLDQALRVLSRPASWQGRPVEIGVSIGVTVLRPAHRRDTAQLFAEADSALYLAKAAGRNRAMLFGEALAEPPRGGALHESVALELARSA